MLCAVYVCVCSCALYVATCITKIIILVGIIGGYKI